ncbi:MAG: DUF378 domain-containing protein [Planctomycetota bacterium]|jgi:uncharacterized membrane protein YuzA (DUF378 family)
MLKLSPVGWVALVLLMVGGLNWGLVGVFDFNLVTTIFGEAAVVEVSEADISVEAESVGGPSKLSKIIYIAVGLAALYIIAVAVIACKGKGACASRTAVETMSSGVSKTESAGQGGGTTD